jgi:hypothetical protein
MYLEASMRLSDLLKSAVVDAAGKDIGHVHDVRLVQDGPPVAGIDHTFRIAGVLVGRGSVGIRLGFHRAGLEGPWLLKSLFGMLETRARYVPWEAVASWKDEHLHLKVNADQLRGVDASPEHGDALRH